ncbi:flagellar hook-associated protein FlgK [Verticiella sediminum]|uniref:Flagellar hook-associated protein 1 n=1 Tax=Verticiella sediminum TaxID=1247510 RepID=A0A556ARX1_9BURK|nr:flagellar hook-associated protein FlgK [Verticiella sediminum]TSH95673.1 flagellar hook-associated protein FlgK [Verticiella sediminum]
MSNLFNLGRAGLNAAQAGLNTTGHNIANANTVGYSRQQVLISTSGGQGTHMGYTGRGVQVDTVRRIHDSFLTNQVNASATVGAALSTYANQLDHVNNLLADRTVGISPALSRFFEGLNAVASTPADPASRQELIGRANSLATQINSAQQFLNEQQRSVNEQLATTTRQINSYAERIGELNQRITEAYATNGRDHTPNDLLDQRDQLVSELNGLVRVTVVNEGDSINLSIGNGQVLLGGNEVFPLQAVASAADPTRTVLAYTTAGGATVELSDGIVDGGSLGGLLQFRREALDVTQNELGRMTLGLAMAVNAQHAQGLDSAGNPGGDFFSLGSPVVFSNAANADPLTTLAVSYTDASALTLNDYQVKFDAASGEFRVTRHPGGAAVDAQTNGNTLSFDGLEVELPDADDLSGDNGWLIQPTRQAARDIGVAVETPDQIAAAGPDGGSANGENALALARLQNENVLAGGTMSVTGAYSQLVNNVGVKAQSVQTAAKAQDTLTLQAFAAQQAVSGVNLNEEYINLDYYVQHYNASARLIEVATNLFDTLLGLRT